MHTSIDRKYERTYRLVIADDDEIQLQGMCCAFPWEELGIEVAAGVEDGDKALAVSIEKKADILLTDIKMSNMDGLDLTERVRKLCPDIHVVIMSAYDEFKFAQKALRLGVDDYLLKPIDLSQLRETFGRIVYQKNEKKRAERDKMYRFNEETGDNLSQKELDEYFDRHHIVNKGLAEYLAKLVVMGNTDMLPKYVGRLKNNLRYTGSDSLLMLSFSLSSILGELRRAARADGPEAERLEEIYSRIIKQRTLDDAMELLEAELNKLAESSKAKEAASMERSIKKACEYIEGHYTEPGLRIGDAAGYSGLSPSYFSTVFAEVTGISFTDYLIERRMKEAQLLLLNSDYKIQEIGYMTGYDNPAYFSAAFKKFTGVSVSQYKKLIKGMGSA